MLHEYRKKTTIKAEQFDGSKEMIEKYDVRDSLRIGYELFHSEIYRLPTKEGIMTIYIGDWIATGIDGEHWAIADDIFRRTYERCD
ncbi:hypothetical protein [Limosilactobacillus antri]|uniref:hypothetical protein n=1 Tax=Limosilactobacillus antri TaxID=227943 RepID=UPI001F583BDE|nr:hypothetical protein [Limosilactobacillus antri]